MASSPGKSVEVKSHVSTDGVLILYSVRDVRKRISAITPQDMAASLRHQRKVASRAKLRKAADQMKPRSGRQPLTEERRSTRPVFRIEGPLGEEIIDGDLDGRIYSALVHWDYFSDFSIPFIAPQQLALDKDGGALKRDRASRWDTSELNESKKDTQKRKLRSVISGSDLSFIISLLDSRWSKSSLRTKTLSDPPTMGAGFWEQIFDTSKTAPSEPPKSDTCSALSRYLQLQPSTVSLCWRPCCGLDCNLYGSTWSCPSCGFSAVLQQARSTSKSYGKNDDEEPLGTDIFAEVVSYVELDPILSGTPFVYSFETNTTESATADFLYQMIASSESDKLNHITNEECNDRRLLHKDGIEQMSKFSTSELLTTDKFGNTTLHYAAAGRNFDKIMMLLNKGVPAEALNTSGQTFLHLLDAQGQINSYIEILHHLMDLPTPFPFLQKDNYGFTIAHRFFFYTNDTEDISPEELSEVSSVLGTQDFRDMELDFSVRFTKVDCEDWAGGDPDLVTMLDKNGDTFLIAMLKAWPENGNWNTLVTLINKLTSHGESKANVNAYDANRNTALAVAASKGLCPAVEQLLDLGANPNATNLAHKSVLKHASEYLHAARKLDDSELYTKIFICQKILVCHGAMKEVTASEEFSLEGPKILEPKGVRKGQSRKPFYRSREGAENNIMDMLPEVKECLGDKHELSKSTFICFRCGRYRNPSTLIEHGKFIAYGSTRRST